MKKQEFLDQFVATGVGQSTLGQPPKQMTAILSQNNIDNKPDV